MASKKPKSTLSTSAQMVTELVERISSGNQRAFARAVGCSQPVLSRILNGRQQPGRELLERIAALPGVDRDELLATLKVDTTLDRAAETMVPVANSLLDGNPASRPDQLTARTIILSPDVYRPSLYAVSAKACEPAYSDALERMRADDLIIIESKVEGMRRNLQILNGKLCVIVVRGSKGNTITLRRVWVKFDAKQADWAVRTCPDAKVENFRSDKYGNRLLRSIVIDLPEALPEPEYVDQVVDVNDIVGIAVQLVRHL